MLSAIHRLVLEARAAHPSGHQAAKSLGMPETTFRTYLKEADRIKGNSNPEASDYRNPPETIIPPEVGYSEKPLKPRISAKADGGAYRILCIGDLHDSPRLPDKSRMRWIARHAEATRPDKIIQIGDFADFASCSTHEAPGTLGYAQKPSFRQDLESLEEALTNVFKILASDIPLLIVEGNHEYRVKRWEENHPAVEGGFYEQLQEAWTRYGWRSSPYGEWVFVGGVGFTHVPHGIMGKPYGGKSSENQIANDALFSIVFGHSHRANFKRAPKIGPSQSIEVLNVGSAMPNGYIAKYAGTATTGWSYGVYDIEVRAGHITSHSFIDMARLESLYGD